MYIKFRLIFGLLLVVAMLLVGAMGRSLWWVPVCTPVFTACFLLGRWRAWQVSVRDQGFARTLQAILITAVTQCVLIGVLYLLGRGFGSVLQISAQDHWQTKDSLACALFNPLAIIGALALQRLESAATQSSKLNSRGLTETLASLTTALDAEHDESKARPELTLSAPLALSEILIAKHYLHDRQSDLASADDASSVRAAEGSESKIAAAEQRLGVAFPLGLRTLYLLQNGGHVGSVCIIKPELQNATTFEEVICPFGGYEDLLPTEQLKMLFELICDYADPDMPEYADQFPEGCKRMLVLARWYQCTLFLDYNQTDAPRVGYVDFEHADGWREHVHWWSSFETFAALLRRYEA